MVRSASKNSWRESNPKPAPATARLTVSRSIGARGICSIPSLLRRYGSFERARDLAVALPREECNDFVARRNAGPPAEHLALHRGHRVGEGQRPVEGPVA